MKKYRVTHDAPLLAYMQEIFHHQSRSKVKKMLQHGQFIINHESITQFDYPLREGQVVGVLSQRESKQIDYLENIDLLYEDADLLSVPTEHPTPDEDSALLQAQVYIQSVDPLGEIYPVHRLDRETSGLMMFAKNQKVQEILQKNWKQLVKTRAYTLLVEGDFPNESARYKSWLKELDNKQMVSSLTDNGGKYAETLFKKCSSNGQWSLLQASLLTGRRNQIRIHCYKMGYPILGDPNYGHAANPLGRLCLHANQLEFIHPSSHKFMSFESPAPQAFFDLLD